MISFSLTALIFSDGIVGGKVKLIRIHFTIKTGKSIKLHCNGLGRVSVSTQISKTMPAAAYPNSSVYSTP